jgi:phenylpropionate dioxygenase-like ring-hydroxylating dioxygenase large terminal subunit
MGDLFRRFWTPVATSAELPEPGGAPVRINVLGEKLVAFRNADGSLGLIDAYCRHRRANLFWGRNEGEGLRCVYHGWKFNASGACVDLPNCPEGPTLKAKVTTPAYPVLERGGLIWAYLGPADLEPPFPHYEAFEVPENHRLITKIVSDGNYFQMLEGDVDSSHVSFLHSKLDGDRLAGSRVDLAVFADRSPRWFTEETPYGIMLSAQRNADAEHFHWRVNQWLMPYITLVAGPPSAAILTQVRVPIDDTSSLHFRVFAHPHRPLTDQEHETFRNGVIIPERIPGTFMLKEDATNDYLIDREAQRTTNYTGIKSIVAQDLAVTQDQGGPIADRSREYLTSSDKAIIALRKRLLTSVKALRDGIEPPEPQRPETYAVRPVDYRLPRDVTLADGARDLLRAGTPAEAAVARWSR